jgi:predicted lipase
MNEHNVTTITTTGHSLGGGLSTLCAFDVGGWLGVQWGDSLEGPFKVTKAKPKVTCISFAAPRVGNATFGEQYRELGVKALRVVNKGDVVPEIPGEARPGANWSYQGLELVTLVPWVSTWRPFSPVPYG